jgi:hypothetical protein
MSFHIYGAALSWFDDCITSMINFNNWEHYSIGAHILVSVLIDVVFHHPYKHQNPLTKKKNIPINIKIHHQKEKQQEIGQQVRN